MIYAVRHGETNYNAEGIMQGRSNLSVLTEKGKMQVQEFAENTKDVIFDVIFCSPLERTKQTLEIILKYHDSPVIFDDRLIEIACGTFENKKKEEKKSKTWKEYIKDPHKFGGETLKDVYYRVKEFLINISDKYKDKDVLLVTHGGIINMMLNINNVKDDETFESFYETTANAVIHNAGFYRIDYLN